MGFEDKMLECVDCKQPFTFSAEEQEFFSSKGYENDPKRCPPCRAARRAGRAGDGGHDGARRTRQMYTVTCASCGQETEVPFEPRDGRPVYCSPCYEKVRR